MSPLPHTPMAAYCTQWVALISTHVQNCQQTSNGTLGIPNCTVEVFQTMGTLWDCTIHPTVPNCTVEVFQTMGTLWDCTIHPTVPNCTVEVFQTMGTLWDYTIHPTVPNCTVEVFQTMGTLWDCTSHPTVPFSVPNNGDTLGLYYSSHCPISYRLQGSSHLIVPWEGLNRLELY